MEIETDIVFIDTGVFEKENFLRGHKIKKIAELSKNGAIKAKVTDITYREIKNRIRKNLLETKTVFKKFGNELLSTGKILKNDSLFDSYFPPIKLDVESIHDRLVTQLDDFLTENKILIVSSSIASIDEVMNQYFDQKKPFGEGQKKDEFPDAFTISTIRAWCKKFKKSAYLISTDNDILEFEDDPAIKPLKDLAELIDVFTRKYESEVFIESVKVEIVKDFKVVSDFISLNYLDEIAYQISLRLQNQYTDLEYSTPVLENLKMDTVYFSEISEGSAKVDMTISMIVMLPITYDNYDFASYDREDDRWWNVEGESTELELEVEFEFEAVYAFESDEGELIDLELEEINNFELSDLKNDDEY